MASELGQPTRSVAKSQPAPSIQHTASPRIRRINTWGAEFY